ncbi:MAG: TIGR02444 family protein [Alphaproteobacteria bacterium]|nr:TIGR02444 family protein [Alphaproteobacteria bacterium]
MTGGDAASSADEFWGWSCKAYAQGGAKRILLSLQDEREINVNALLWASWLAHNAQRLTPASATAAAHAVAAVSSRLTGPLRTARREAKYLAPSLYGDMKELELKLERFEQATILLAASTVRLNRSNQELGELMSDNLCLMLQAFAVVLPADEVSSLASILAGTPLTPRVADIGARA